MYSYLGDELQPQCVGRFRPHPMKIIFLGLTCAATGSYSMTFFKCGAEVVSSTSSPLEPVGAGRRKHGLLNPWKTSSFLKRHWEKKAIPSN